MPITTNSLKLTSDLKLSSIATPVAPGAGLVVIYTKSDGKIYYRAGATGAESVVGVGGFGNYTIPSTDGSSGYALVTNGLGTLSWAPSPAQATTTLTSLGIGAAAPPTGRLDISADGYVRELSNNLSASIVNISGTMSLNQLTGNQLSLIQSWIASVSSLRIDNILKFTSIANVSFFSGVYGVVAGIQCQPTYWLATENLTNPSILAKARGMHIQVTAKKSGTGVVKLFSIAGIEIFGPVYQTDSALQLFPTGVAGLSTTSLYNELYGVAGISIYNQGNSSVKESVGLVVHAQSASNITTAILGITVNQTSFTITHAIQTNDATPVCPVIPTGTPVTISSVNNDFNGTWRVASSIGGSATGTITFLTSSALTVPASYASGQITLDTAFAAIFRGGRVGIGVDHPKSELDVKGTLLLTGSGSGYVGFKPATNAGSTIYTLPSTSPSAGSYLRSDISNNLYWSDAVSSRAVATVSRTLVPISNIIVADDTPVSSIVFTVIPQTYKDLFIRFTSLINDQYNQYIQLRFNNSTNFYYSTDEISSGAGNANNQYPSLDYIICGRSASNIYNTENTSEGEINIPRYSSTVNAKSVYGRSIQPQELISGGSGSPTVWSIGGRSNQTSAITTISFTPSSGSFVYPTSFYLYGVSEA